MTEGLQVADRFRLVRLLGQGGMGSVWLADHLALEIPCAIKFIDREQNSPEARRRFEREAKAAAQLRGQHVVQILDHGIWEGVPYIAMEYLEGEDLAARLDRVGMLSPGQTVRIVAQVAKGLTRAHAAGIVHRDLKPENIFLTTDGEDEVVKVLDFGIAKRSQATLSEAGTKTGSLLGTPFYMSPEQARGVKGIDHRSDLFSLAIIVYQCVTGKLPFYSEGLGDVLAQIMYEPIPVPSQHSNHAPPAFDAWWQRAAARPMEERFQSAKELVDALVLALGVSGTIDIPALAPRPAEPSSVDLSGERLPPGSMGRGPMAPTQLAPAARRPDHPTIDHPLTRTFDPSPMPTGWQRKRTVVLGSLALVLAAILFIAFGGKKSGGGAIEPAAAARGSDSLERPGAANEPSAAARAPSGAATNEDTPKPDDAPPVASSGHVATGTAPTAPSPPVGVKRKNKPANRGTGGTAGAKRDYGI